MSLNYGLCVFADMIKLDGDVKRLRYNKRYAERDIVQVINVTATYEL